MAHADNPLIPPPATPDPALRRLDRLVGEWELTGSTLDSAKDNITGRTTFEWLPGGFFLKCSGEINFGERKIQSLELIGYDPASGTFPASVYSNLSGEVSPYYWDVQGDTVTHWLDTATYIGTLSADGQTLIGGWRPAGPRGDSDAAYDAVMTRVR